jgi:hypothetical protein
MTPNKQVSPAIRILRGERDASARATHLEAATEKYSVTTIERKQMSTTTNFKRIALVAVAALGLGVLSSVPSQATINSDAVTLSSATAAQTTAETYTATSAVATVSFFGAEQDSLTVTAALVSTTAASNTSMPVLRLVETSSAIIDTLVPLAASAGSKGFAGSSAGTAVLANTATRVAAASSSVTTTAKYAVYLATSGAATAAPTTAGTYVIRLTPAAIGVGPLVGATAQTLTITVTTAATLSTTIAAANSTAYLQNKDTDASAAAQDSTVVALKTASTTVAGNLYVNAKNASNVAAANIESVTATITGAGTLGISTGAPSTTGTVIGRSINIKPNSDRVLVFPDGTSGVGTITLTGTTSGVLIATKTVSFSGTVATKYAASTIASTDSSVIAVGGSTKVSALLQDADGNLVSGLVGNTTGGDYWAFSSDTTVATVTTGVTSMSATAGYYAQVLGVKAGTAQIIFGNASTLAASTIKSVGVNVRVGTATPSNVTVTTDKASYAPGEKITVTVTILDASGLAVVGATSYAGIFSSTGIVASPLLSSGTLPGTSAIADYSNTSNTKTYTVYAPVVGGAVTLSYTGGTALATANQVAKTVTFSVTDSGAAALAAVTALAVTVASLKTLITTLTNLVLKIQKKVKA